MRLPSAVRRIPHVRQSFNWDCGLACTEMALRALGVSKMECSLPKLRKRVPTSSVWTVDLAYLLADYGVRFRYLTTTIGVDDGYDAEPFYKATLDSDRMRVNKLFEQATSNNVVIERGSLSSETLQELMRPHDHMVMALVDRRHLDRPPPTSVSGIVESCIARCFSGYVGHYVLITGYDAERQAYHIMDPAKSHEPNLISCATVDLARRSYGTDEDLIVIPWEQPQRRSKVATRSSSASAAA